MIDYAVPDAVIDQIVWTAINDSSCAQDFRDYLRHAPEGSLHRDDAIDRLIAIDEAETSCSDAVCSYSIAIKEIETLANAGNSTAQIHMGKVLALGIGINEDRDRSTGFYQLAILQGEPRSHVNLALRLDEHGTPESIAEARRLLTVVSELGEGTATFHLGRMISRGRGEEADRPDPVKSFELFHQAWDQGFFAAGHWIGYQLINGNGVRQDTELGHEWVKRAADRGCIGAINALASNAEFGTGGMDKDVRAALSWYQKGAELGNEESQQRLANILLRGEGVPKDGALAVNWLKRAAVCGDSVAQRILGLTYIWGIDVIRNSTFGKKWLTRSAEQGDAHGAYHLGKILQREDPPRFDEAYRWFDKAARTGHSEAQGCLGICFWYGQGVAPDPEAAFKWINLCALQGDTWGLYLLGRLHYTGISVPINYVKAAQCFRDAAVKGHPGGQAKLGWCYLHGEGVDKDVAQGMVWISRAAEQGDEGACTTIGYVLRDGIGVDRNPAEASKWFLDAAKNGDMRGQYELAMLYAEGIGLEQNLEEAKRWMEVAANQGDEDATSWLANQESRLQSC
jgi:TPR repeat protein